MSKTDKGLYSDCSEADQPEGTYRFAKNIIDSNVLEAKENEDGFTKFNDVAPYTVIGVIPVERSWVIFTTDNSNSEVGLVTRTNTTLSYTTIYSDTALNFSTDSPIKGEYRKDVNGERIVTWIEDNNVPRILNIDNPAGINDIQDLNIFQDVNNPEILTSSINDFGGSLPTGAILLITRYKNKDGSETNWFVHDHVFYINDDSKTSAFNLDDGAVPGTISNKSITVTLTNSDTNYDTLVVGYLKSSNGIVTAYSTLTLTNNSTLSFTISGSEATTSLTLDEVLTSTTNYNTAKAITQLSGALVLANLTAEDLPDLQPYANAIRVSYTHSLLNVISNTNTHKDNLPPSLMPGEVYALYLGVELNKGGWAFYHIPGRPAVGTEKQTVTNEGLTYNRFQIENTADTANPVSNLGYWENSSELYPNTDVFNGSISGEDLRNTPVRHHRMPTTDYLVEHYYSGDSTVGITTLPLLGLTALNVNIPSEVQAKIKRWKIFYAKKSENTSLVMGSDLLHLNTTDPNNSSIRWSSGGNWVIHAVQAGSDGWRDMNPVFTDSLRGHSLDFLYNSPSVTPTYARFNYQLIRGNLNADYLGFRGTGGRLTITGDGRGQVASAVIDYTVPSATARVGNNHGFKRLDNFTYLPPNSTNGKFTSLYNEGSFVADINNPSTFFDSVTPIRLETNSTGEPADIEQFRNSDGSSFPDPGESTMYMQYFRLLTNVHTSVFQQDLIPLEGYGQAIDTTKTFSGGDTFLSYMSYLTCAPLNANPDSTLGVPTKEGVRIWRGYIGYSRYNWNYRYQTTGDISTYYHGKTDIRTLFSPVVTTALAHDYISLIDVTQAQNTLNYDPSYSALNEFVVGTIFDPSITRETSFPDTIIWSNLQPEEQKEFSWRTFPAGNRYVIPKNKGDIINLQGWRNKDLLIHTQYSLFKTRTDIQIAANGENVFFKSINLFDLAPEEIIPTTTGYAGTQNKFGCLLTKVGYVFASDLQGKVFLFNGENLEEISTNGQRMFFRDYMGIKANNADNPFTDNGYTLGYDERVNRIILTKKNITTGESWTISYNPFKKTWTSYHDYIPDYLFNTVDGILYSIKDNIFYANTSQGEDTVKGVYYNVDPIPSYIDVVHTDGSYQDKTYIACNWTTESYPNTYLGNKDLDYFNTLTHLTLRTPEHCTGRVPLVQEDYFDSLYTANIRILNRSWYFDGLRDIMSQQGFVLGFYNNYDIDPTKLDTNTEWFNKRKFTDKYVICRYEYDNIINNKLLFLESSADYRYEKR